MELKSTSSLSKGGSPTVAEMRAAGTMQIGLEGELESILTRGIGPIKFERSKKEPFELVIAEGESVSPLPGLTLELVRSRNSWVLSGRLRGMSCTFAEFPHSAAPTDFRNFVMVSVGGCVLRGKATVESTSSQAQLPQVYVA